MKYLVLKSGIDFLTFLVKDKSLNLKFYGLRAVATSILPEDQITFSKEGLRLNGNSLNQLGVRNVDQLEEIPINDRRKIMGKIRPKIIIQ